jgi:di/tricarboxylate transporter
MVLSIQDCRHCPLRVGELISFTFISPFSHQGNLMVMGPGAYSTRTFAKFGAPLLVMSLATVSVVTWALLGSG